MNIFRIVLSIILIIYNSITILGYWIVLSPTERDAGSVLNTLTFLFVGFGIVGGFLAIFKNQLASIFILLSFVLYISLALHQPLENFGLSAFLSLHRDTYISIALRGIVSAALIATLYIHRHQSSRTFN